MLVTGHLVTRLCHCSLSYCFRASHPAFAFRALSHRVLADPHLTRSLADPNRDGQHPHSRPVYVKRLWHNFAWQCSHEQTACLVEKTMDYGDGAASLTVIFLYSLPLTILTSSAPAN